MKLLLGVITAAVSLSETFEKLTDHLPADLPAAFQCDSDSRIIGGVKASDAWPFLVQMRMFKTKQQAKNNPDSHYQCGAVIIHDKWAMTGIYLINIKFINRRKTLYF